MPNGGMNEMGLMVEVLWLNQAVYPERSSKIPALNELQFIQYLIDNFSAVDEALIALPKIRVAELYAKVHYLMCDAMGQCATVEYLNGKLQVHTLKKLPVAVLTNHPYKAITPVIRNGTAPPSKPSAPKTLNSKVRFSLAAHAQAKFNNSGYVSIEQVFEALDQTKVKRTQWQIVYDPIKMALYFRVGHAVQNNSAFSSVDFESLRFDCKLPSVAQRLKEATPGTRSQMKPFTLKQNRELVKEATIPIAKHLPAEAIELISQYPATLKCTKN
jgi:hypothetical protein